MKPYLFKARAIKLFDHIKTSFWFVPMLCIITSLLVVYTTYQIDLAWWNKEHTLFSALYNISPDNANTMLSSIATSVITMTSIAFSMIVVTLTLASSQFGPRLLRNFMQDKKNQWALGSLVAIFCYCLTLIRLASSTQASAFVPGLGLSFALLLAVLAVFILVFLIHHVAISIQAESVVAHCWQELAKDIDRLFPAENSAVATGSGELVWDEELTHLPQFSQHDGYVQLIDYKRLMKELEECEAGIEIKIKPGSYVITGECIGKVFWPEKRQDKPSKNFLDCYLMIGKSRTPIQDPEFAIHQLVEIALRALSPSINDPFTAILCINRLGSALRRTANRNFPQASLLDSNKTIRIKRKIVDYNGLVEAACNQIRQNSVSHASVVIAFIEMLTQVTSDLCHEDHKKSLIKQADAMVDMASNLSLHANDLEDIRTRQQKLHAMVTDIH